MNVLVVMADQLVPFLTSPYGDPVARTPNMQRLADEGIRYDAAYTPYPLCSPARAAFMTGDYASKHGCYDNAAILPADVPTVAHSLTLAGYDTVLSGKMHFVGPDQLHGFAKRLTTDVYPAAMDWVPMQDPEGRFVRGGHARSYVPPRVGVVPWSKFLAYDEETHFRALEYLRNAPEEPFFLVVSYHHPHDPFQVTQELWDLYDGVDIPIPETPDDVEYSAMDVWANEAHETDAVDLRDPDNLCALRRAYYGLVTYIDRKLGELLDAIPDDTLVIFTSDHGDMLAERAMVQKRCFYEWSARIPLLVRHPDGRRGVVDTPVSLLDLAPTILDVAGAEERLPMDGGSLFEPSGVVFSEYHVEKVRAPCFMVRRDNWKYVYIHGHGEQLFDLDADPHEWMNLAGEHDTSEVRALILEQFDPDAIARHGAASVRRRDLIARAMARTTTRWDYSPFFDATKQYVR
ncbi:MAG TPA: sulfatase-like hydrolase/transferase [Gaiellaceae bacterium]